MRAGLVAAPIGSLSWKFEAKALKVIEYSRKDSRVWEFSDKAIQLIEEYKVRPALTSLDKYA